MDGGILSLSCVCGFSDDVMSRNHIGLILIAGLLAVGVSIVVSCWKLTGDHPGCDFTFRMNELLCLKQGVDPYDVWSGRVSVPPFESCGVASEQEVVPIDHRVFTYPPWEYAYMLPLSCLSRNVSWGVYFSLWVIGFVVVYFIGRRHFSSPIPVSCALLVVSYVLFSDLQVGNFGVFVLLSACLMAASLNSGKSALSGVCWAVAMVKPQLALLFAVPLLLKGKMLTCVVAIAVCLGVSFVPAVICGKSPVTLILEVPGSNVEFFQGCGTCPYWFCSWISSEVCIVVGLIIGLLLCVTMTFAIRKERDWFLLQMPAAICGCTWSYAHSYCHALGWFLAFVLVRELVRNPRSKFLWTMLALSAFVLSRWFLAWHGLCAFMGWRFPMSEYAFRCVDSLNSTASIVLAAVFCVWKGRQSANDGVF